jgi:hypothetical protein
MEGTAMKCLDCKEEILAKNVDMCPYCFSENIVPDTYQTPENENK